MNTAQQTAAQSQKVMNFQQLKHLSKRKLRTLEQSSRSMIVETDEREGVTTIPEIKDSERSSTISR